MERIQKILARGGVSSRRAAEELIVAGRVRVNGQVVSELGAKADPRRDRVEVDGKRIVAEQAVYVALHKPRGVVSTMSDPEGRPTVRELVASIPARVYPVGRLDFATSGLLLATNDGAFADGLLHPRQAVPKMYVVKVKGVMKPEDLDVWRKGIRLEDGMTLPAEVSLIRHETDKTWMTLTIREGRNQQIRRMGEATNFPVMRLARVAFADVTLEGLGPGRWRYLSRDELVKLKKTYGVPRSIPSPPEAEPVKRGKARPLPAPRRGSGARGQGSAEGGAKEWGHRPSARRNDGDAEERTSRFRGRGGEGGGARGDDRGARGAARGDDRGARGAARGDDRGARGDDRGARGAARGDDRGARGDDRGARGAARGDDRGAHPARRGAARGQARGEDRRGGGHSRGDDRGARGHARGDDRGSARGAGRGHSREGEGAAPRGETSPRYDRGGARGSARGAGRGHSREGEGAAPRGETSPRYGGGSPARRGYNVTDDWGGGAGRGKSAGSSERRDDRAPPPHGGRHGRTRTTGTSGGIGSREPAPRVKGRRRS